MRFKMRFKEWLSEQIGTATPPPVDMEKTVDHAPYQQSKLAKSKLADVLDRTLDGEIKGNEVGAWGTNFEDFINHARNDFPDLDNKFKSMLDAWQQFRQKYLRVLGAVREGFLGFGRPKNRLKPDGRQESYWNISLQTLSTMEKGMEEVRQTLHSTPDPEMGVLAKFFQQVYSQWQGVAPTIRANYQNWASSQTRNSVR